MVDKSSAVVQINDYGNARTHCCGCRSSVDEPFGHFNAMKMLPHCPFVRVRETEKNVVRSFPRRGNQSVERRGKRIDLSRTRALQSSSTHPRMQAARTKIPVCVSFVSFWKSTI